MEAFKNPLTPDKEKEYIKACQNGDTDARAVLLECNLRLVAHIARKYSSAVRDSEELISIGTIGLIKAIDTFKEDKGCRLSGYAAKCIENEILMALRQEKKKSREVSMYEPIGTDREGNEIVIMDIISAHSPNAVDALIHNEHLNALPDCIKQGLTRREQTIIGMRYGLTGCPPMTQRETAAKLGISRSYVSRIEKKALSKLHSRLES